MAKHLISVLGTGLYEPVEYAFEGKSLGKHEFIQAALIRHFREELEKGGKVSIFITEGAKKDNWENRLYTERDAFSANRWDATEKENVISGNTKQGLSEFLTKEFGTGFPIEGVPIQDAHTESQIWSVFQTIYEKIEDGDEIIFDITHSFRSIPMLAITILNFARIMKNCTIYGIYYGAYEAKKENHNIAPVIDLTIYNNILQWTSATDTFIRYGNADQIEQLYIAKKDSLDKNDPQTKEWKDFEKVIKSMSLLSDTLTTCRGIDANKLKQKGKNKSSRSIRCAYQDFKQKVEKEYPESIKEMVPLHQLMDKAKESYKSFDKDQDYLIGCEVIRWSIQSGMIQQGYTALEETVKTYLCYMYDLDNKEKTMRDNIIGEMLNALVKFNQNTKNKFKIMQYSPEVRKVIQEYISKEDRSTSKLFSNQKESKENLNKYNEIIQTLPIELAITANAIKNKRNDINHFGFNPNPSSAEDLKKDLIILFHDFESFVQEKTPEFQERIENYRKNTPQ